MFKQLKIATLVAVITSTSVYASSWILEHALDNVLSQVGNAAGARLGDEIYYGSSRSAPHHKHTATHRTHHKKKRKHSSNTYRPKGLTPGMKIQIALRSLGFYRGLIDGEVNSFETRSAIKAMNQAYGIDNTAMLKPEEKDMLIYLGTLFGFDRNLIAKGNDRRTKAKKIQTALKVLGFYHGNIDGVAGSGTRRAIAEFKEANGLSSGTALDFEEEYRLISGAKEKNDRLIEETIASLKALGTPQTYAPVRPAHQYPAPQQSSRKGAVQPIQTYQKRIRHDRLNGFSVQDAEPTSSIPTSNASHPQVRPSQAQPTLNDSVDKAYDNDANPMKTGQ